ncbi:MAG: TatD family hydrolase [Desulfatibacillaceae bacterium]|nr:TatD family hydrolase [Desulfatibacillaceae bacterium]
MRLFDSHSHIDDRAFDNDRDAVLARAHEAGVLGVMLVGITQKTCMRALEIAAATSGLFVSLGVHPHDCKSCSEKIMQSLVSLAGRPKVKAWGETGLDFDRMFSPQKDQERWFVRQLEIAAELGLPVILHERSTKGRFLEMLKAHLPPQGCVVHCFSGSKKELSSYLDMGCFIGITGIVTNKTRGEELRRQVRSIPANRLLVETDAPYLVPSPERNKFRRNEPAFVKSTFLELAHLRGDEPAKLAEQTFQNTLLLYGIDETEVAAPGAP